MSMDTPAFTTIVFLIFLASAAYLLFSWYQKRATKTSFKLFSFPKSIEGKLEVVLFLGGAVLLIGSQIYASSLPLDVRKQSLPYLILGFILFVLGAHAVRGEYQPKWLARGFERVSKWLHIEYVQIVYLSLSLGFAIIATMSAGFEANMRNLPLAIISWILSILFVIAGSWQKQEGNPSISLQTVRWMALFFFVGFLLRGINTGQIPRVLTGDEASQGLSAVDILSGRINNVFAVGWAEFPNLYYYFLSLAIAVFGPITSAIRITSALIGAATVAGIYALGRAMYGHRTGLIAAIFLAGFHYHIHFSRLASNYVWDGLSFVIVLGALWYGWSQERRSAYLLAGIGFGFGLYFYASVRILFILIPVFLLIAGLLDRDRFKRNLNNLVISAFSGLITFFPMGWYFLTHREDLLAPHNRFAVLGNWLTNEVEFRGMTSWQILSERFITSIQSYTFAPFEIWYTPGVPMLRTVPAAIFIIGIGLLMLRLRDSRSLIILGWLGIFTVIGTLSLPVLAAQRYNAAAPGVALVIGYALVEFTNMLSKVWKKRITVFHTLALVLVIILAIDDARYYFMDFTPSPKFADANTWVAQRLADRLQEKDEGWQVAFFGSPRMGYRSISSLPYLAPHVEGFDMNHPWGSFENPELTSDKRIFVFLAEHEDDLEAVKADFPGGELSEEYYINNEFLFWMYEVNLSDN